MFQVLKASHKTNSSSNNKTTHNNNKIVENGIQNGNGAFKRSPDEKITALPDKKKRILEKVQYEDLERSNKSDGTQDLKLSKVHYINFQTVMLLVHSY